MKVAIVFDSAGTLVKIMRVIKDLKKNKFICNSQTVDIVDKKKGRALVIIKEDPLKVVDKENPEKLISDLLKEVEIGISYCNPPINREGILKRYEVETGYGSALIIDTYAGEVEYTIATAGCLFKEVKETIKQLKDLGVKVFIASGDRKGFIKRLAEITGVDERYIMAEAHQELKRDLIRNLKKEGYFTIMVGDGANDVPAMIESDLAVVTLQNGNVSRRALETADIKIYNIKEIVDICKKVINGEIKGRMQIKECS